MKTISDAAIRSLWDLQEGERLALSRRRIEDVHSPRMAEHFFAYGYTPFKKPDPYRYLGACLDDGMPENTGTVSVPLAKREEPKTEPATEQPLETPPENQTGAIAPAEQTTEKIPEIPLA